MGRQPHTSLDCESDTPIAEGHLAPEIWARLVVARVNRRESGTLVASRADVRRTFRFLNGSLILATSTSPSESFTATMVACGLLDTKRLAWIRRHTGAHESEIEGLIGAGTLMRSDVDAHHDTHISHLVAATLAWPDGEFTWQPSPTDTDRIERTLLPKVDPVEALVGGVLSAFERTSLRTFVDAADAGAFVPDSRLVGEPIPSWIPADISTITTSLGQGHSCADMAADLCVAEERMAALLWLLEATGWTQRAHPPAALIPQGEVAILQAGAPPATTPSAPVAIKPPETAPVTPSPAATAPKPPPASTRQKAAPQPAPPQPAAPPARDADQSLRQALNAIAGEDFDTAYRLLSDIRREKPSCPQTLAALGWSAWRTGNLGTNAYDGPEDFLLLALTFDAAHPRALEYYARIAIEKGETESARNRLLQLLKAAPDSPWAEEALSQLSPQGKKSGLRLWPKGT